MTMKMILAMTSETIPQVMMAQTMMFHLQMKLQVGPEVIFIKISKNNLFLVEGDFCKDRPSGTYIWEGSEYECSDQDNGGWIKVSEQTDPAPHSGDDEPTTWGLPSWWADSGINQYLFTFEGTTLDYAYGSG